jgi:hypothetical protein
MVKLLTFSDIFRIEEGGSLFVRNIGSFYHLTLGIAPYRNGIITYISDIYGTEEGGSLFVRNMVVFTTLILGDTQNTVQ